MASLNTRTIAAVTFFVGCLSACDSYNEPTTNEEWKAFCEAPDSAERIKAIKDQGQRQKAASSCFNAPWQKATLSKPRSW